MAYNRWLADGMARGSEYDDRFAKLAATGKDMHGEADFVASFGFNSVLDAGCGTGRVAIELNRRGIDVVGVDLDPAMLDAARAKASEQTWILGDLSSCVVTEHGTGEIRHFDAVVMAGNVMIFLTPGSESVVVANMARHLNPGGYLIAGFQLQPGRLSLDDYDHAALAAGLVFVERWASWGREPFIPETNYAVSVHQLS